MRDFNHGFSRIGSLTLPVRKAGASRKFEIGRALAKAIRVIRGSIIMLLAMPLALRAAEPTIAVTATPRYPWSGMVDLTFTITGDSGVKYDTSFKVLDVEGNEALPIKTVYKSDGSRASATESLLPGTYRWSWDAKADVEEDLIKSSGCLSTASAVVYKNRQLSSVTEFSAIPCGKAISDKTQRVKGTWVKADGNGKEVQFAAADDKFTKCVCVHFEQQGSDIVANIKWAKYVDGTTSTAKDFNAISATSQTIATSEDASGYGLRSVAIKTSDYKAPFCCERVSVVGTVSEPLNGVQLWENGPYWAECNVGATKPEAYGYYFCWGGTIGYYYLGDTVSGNNWKSSDGSCYGYFGEGNCPTYGKSNGALRSSGYINSAGNLVPAHDAATVYLGAPWRMPTKAEVVALVSNCDTKWTMRNGVYGCLVSGKGSYSVKSIFLPAAGYGYGSMIAERGSVCRYWSSTPSTSSDCYWYAWYLWADSSGASCSDYSRDDGRTVRPVRMRDQ